MYNSRFKPQAVVTSSQNAFTAFCKILTKIERLIPKIHINKVIQLAKLSDSEAFHTSETGLRAA